MSKKLQYRTWVLAYQAWTLLSILTRNCKVTIMKHGQSSLVSVGCLPPLFKVRRTQDLGNIKDSHIQKWLKTHGRGCPSSSLGSGSIFKSSLAQGDLQTQHENCVCHDDRFRKWQITYGVWVSDFRIVTVVESSGLDFIVLLGFGLDVGDMI